MSTRKSLPTLSAKRIELILAV